MEIFKNAKNRVREVCNVTMPYVGRLDTYGKGEPSQTSRKGGSSQSNMKGGPSNTFEKGVPSKSNGKVGPIKRKM